jgi:phage-related protein
VRTRVISQVARFLTPVPKSVHSYDGTTVQSESATWLPQPLVDGLGSGLYEIRSSHAKTEYRVFFCTVASRIVLLHGVVKKTQKTRRADLELARSRLKEVMER